MIEAGGQIDGKAREFVTSYRASAVPVGTGLEQGLPAAEMTTAQGARRDLMHMKLHERPHYDLKHLFTFVVVAEELNFHRAAKRLTMAQPAVSRIILELEARLGVRLLERTTRRVRLTESGRYLLEEAQEILARIGDVEQTVRMLAAGAKAVLRIGSTTVAGHSLVPDIAQEYRNQSIDVQLELASMTSATMREKILEGEIDFGFALEPIQGADIETRRIAGHVMMALLPASHPLAMRDQLTVEDLSGEPLVLGGKSTWPVLRRIVASMFQNARLPMKIGQEASSLADILGLVSSGLGIAIYGGIPRFLGEGSIIARPILTEDGTLIETHLAWRRGKLNPAMRQFIETSEKVGKTYVGN